MKIHNGAGDPCGLLLSDERNRGHTTTSADLLFHIANILMFNLAIPQLNYLKGKLGGTNFLRTNNTPEMCSAWKETVAVTTLLVCSFYTIHMLNAD